MSHRRAVRPSLILLLVAAVAAVLAGCTTGEKEREAADTEASQIDVGNAWVGAATDGDDVTVAAAGVTLTNTSGTDLTLVSVTADGVAESVVFVGADGQLDEAELVIPGGGTLTLGQAPGPSIELRGLTEPVTVGIEVPFVLSFGDGSSLSVDAVGVATPGELTPSDPAPTPTG